MPARLEKLDASFSSLDSAAGLGLGPFGPRALLAEELDRRIQTLRYLKSLQQNSTPDLELGASVVELASVRKSNSRGEVEPPAVPEVVQDDRWIADSSPDVDEEDTDFD